MGAAEQGANWTETQTEFLHKGSNSPFPEENSISHQAKSNSNNKIIICFKCKHFGCHSPIILVLIGIFQYSYTH